MRRGLSTLCAGLAIAAPAAAQAMARDGDIWVQCELAPGATPGQFGYFGGVMLIGEGVLRGYDPTTRMLGDNQCAYEGFATRCQLTADEFVIDSRSGPQHWQGRIDRRTGAAHYSYDNPDRPDRGGRVESVCRGATDPRPPAQF